MEWMWISTACFFQNPVNTQSYLVYFWGQNLNFPEPLEGIIIRLAKQSDRFPSFSKSSNNLHKNSDANEIFIHLVVRKWNVMIFKGKWMKRKCWCFILTHLLSWKCHWELLFCELQFQDWISWSGWLIFLFLLNLMDNIEGTEIHQHYWKNMKAIWRISI